MNVVALWLNNRALDVWSIGNRLGRVEEGESWPAATAVYYLARGVDLLPLPEGGE